MPALTTLVDATNVAQAPATILNAEVEATRLGQCGHHALHFSPRSSLRADPRPGTKQQTYRMLRILHVCHYLDAPIHVNSPLD